MKAVLLFESHRLFRAISDRIVVMKMDLYELELLETEAISDSSSRYRFSWIAFDQEDPEMRVLFDSHLPKGPHFHIDGDQDGQPFAWFSIQDAIQFFHTKVTEHFGELSEISDEGEQD